MDNLCPPGFFQEKKRTAPIMQSRGFVAGDLVLTHPTAVRVCRGEADCTVSTRLPSLAETLLLGGLSACCLAEWTKEAGRRREPCPEPKIRSLALKSAFSHCVPRQATKHPDLAGLGF